MDSIDVPTAGGVGTLAVPAFLVRELECEVGTAYLQRLWERPADLAMALFAMRAVLRHRWLAGEGLAPG